MAAPVKHDLPNILLVNPWIHDFAAYDYWAKPFGLLLLAAILRRHGFKVSYLDCLDRFHPKAPQTDPSASHGRGPYLKTRIPKPEGLEDVHRNFSRYGIKKDWFIEDLRSVGHPDLIFVTSLMTYWYPGVQETIGIVRQKFPETPIILGGIYATLCTAHAIKICGADQVISGPGVHRVLKLAEDYTGYSVKPKFDPDNLNTYPITAFDLQRKIPYIPLLTSLGCPFSCTYCASNFLNPKHMRRDPESVVEEIKFWHDQHGIKNFSFYDDALLINPHQHVIPILNGIINSGINAWFHTPNAVHAREITDEIARLMKKAGFKTIRLGIETGAFSFRTEEPDKKVTEKDFKRAVLNLKNAGFRRDEIGAYLLAGLPGESLSTLKASIQMVKACNITPILAYYTPIPHTVLWQKAATASRYDLESDPVFTNNAISPCRKDPFSWNQISLLKNLASF